jgi:hypothetical protein
MDTTTVRMLTLAAAGTVALGIAGTAQACDQCMADTQHTNSGICWSGITSGSFCTGGQADNTWCTSSGSCANDPFNASAACDYNRWSGFSTVQGCS